ncbi:SDR family NAD(P)-dependent oxidoreductase, partial [Mesorhizobium sp. M00.F.Ca.ET.186.01.1.1]
MDKMEKTPWAFISGASGEIGQAIGTYLAEAGVPLYLHYNRSESKLDRLVQLCQERNVPFCKLQADLRDPAQIAAMFAQMPSPPLLIVNNASADHVGLFTDVSVEMFDELVAMNVRSAFLVCAKRTWSAFSRSSSRPTAPRRARMAGPASALP